MADTINKTSLAARIKAELRHLFARMGYSVRRISPDDLRYMTASYDDTVALPPEATSVLRHDHPDLQALREAYQQLDFPVCRHTAWGQRRLSRELTLPWFRGDNAYVWQYRQVGSEIRLKQYLALRYVEAHDDLRLLSRLTEDGAFGCWAFTYGRRSKISRDLVESINEINFLNRQLGIANQPHLRVLDIGAGYGRLAYRMVEALPNLVQYDCVDAVPESTFLCDYYLKFRGVNGRARALPLHQLEKLGGPDTYALAVNIHSFSECARVSVRWWLALLQEKRVPYLLVVPNEPEELLTTEADGSKLDFLRDIQEFGYELEHKAPVYDDDELISLIGVRDHFFLFRNKNQSPFPTP